jgi:prepilin-type N-terminal cleavage/methylation domain-containing protein
MPAVQNSRRRVRPEGGFTLTEALIASAILAIAVAAAALPFSASLQSSQRRADQAEALRLGEGLMEEILSRPFQDPDGPSALGPEAGEVVAQREQDFDNVDDYHGLYEDAGQLRDAEGQAVTDTQAATLRRWATVTYVRMPEQPAESPDSFAIVEVVVSNGKEVLARITRLVADEEGSG